MSWPTPQDYNEAVQSPALCFSLPELRGGRPELTPLGLPRAVTGGLASVYRMSYRGCDWAVRCFLRQVPDQRQRYESISEHLSSTGLPYTAGFQYLEQGIKVQGRWYPVLKMDWVQGLPLNTYVQHNLSRPEKLRALADQWLKMLQDLRRQGVAHGDLQHGNVLVHDGKLFLIDYDGMYVPALSQRGSNELGHRNYQHPLRTGSHFGPWLDNFSGWLVYLSLLALSYEPALWQLAGDEHLLLRKDDFERPGGTEVWKLLEGSREEVPALTASLLAFLKLDPAQVPAPEPTEVERVVKRRPRIRVRATRPGRVPDVTKTAPTFAGPSWVLDHLVPEEPPGWQGSLRKERLLAGLWLLSSAAVASTTAQGALALATAGYLIGGSSLLALIGLGSRYLAQPSVRQKQLLQQEKRSLKWMMRLEYWRAKRLDSRRSRLQRSEETDRAVFRQRVENILEQERTALQHIDGELEQGLLKLEDRRQQYRLGQARELAQILANKRTQIVQKQLRDYSVLGSSSLALPVEVKVQLDRTGLQSAADLADVRVNTIAGQQVVTLHLTGRGTVPAHWLTPVQGQTLLRWRQGLEQALLPAILTPAYGGEGAAVQRKYKSLLSSLAKSAADLEVRASRRRVVAGKQSRNQTDKALRWLKQRQKRLSFPAGKVQSELSRRLERIAVAQQDLRDCSQQLSAHRAVTFSTYLVRLVGLKPTK